MKKENMLLYNILSKIFPHVRRSETCLYFFIDSLFVIFLMNRNKISFFSNIEEKPHALSKPWR